MIRIYNARDVMEAQEAVNLLKENGIPAYYQDGSGGVAVYGVSGFGLFGVDVYVDETDGERAGQVLRKEFTAGNMMETERLILRRWEDADAESLYEYAKDPDVGPIAGWPAHRSVDESREIIKNVFSDPEVYAVCLKDDNKAIGAIALKLNGATDMTDKDDECELGYWIGKPFWGRGLIPEAAEEMIRHGFEDLGMKKIWCGCYDGNVRSERVQEKCGFRYQWTSEGMDVPLMKEKRTGHVSLLTKEDWLDGNGII